MVPRPFMRWTNSPLATMNLERAAAPTAAPSLNLLRHELPALKRLVCRLQGRWPPRCETAGLTQGEMYARPGLRCHRDAARPGGAGSGIPGGVWKSRCAPAVVPADAPVGIGCSRRARLP